MSRSSFDAVVVGAGVFGVWIAHHLQRRNWTVLVVDASGPGNSRASSGGESRLIRMGYGGDEIYTRWAVRSLAQWTALFAQTGQRLFHRTGVLWLAREADPYSLQTVDTLPRAGVAIERLTRADLETRYPQIALDDIGWAILEPESGVLLARRAVHAVLDEAARLGVEYRPDLVAPPAGARGTRSGQGRLETIRTARGESVAAGTFIFACGAWLPTLFPDLLGPRIFPTRQDVFFFGTPGGDRRFSAPALPAWIDFGNGAYGTPDLESRGFKAAFDRHGPRFDPDRDSRLVLPESVDAIRAYVGRRFPALAGAPIVETRVCQYENTSNGDFLIDRHPDFENVWLVGGGSGHGFKHGPAVGEHVAGVLEGSEEPILRFALTSKATVQQRTVY